MSSQPYVHNSKIAHSAKAPDNDYEQFQIIPLEEHFFEEYLLTLKFHLIRVRFSTLKCILFNKFCTSAYEQFLLRDAHH